MSDTSSTPVSPVEDRRKYNDLRTIFEDAYRISIPYLDPAQGIGGIPLTRYMYIALREAFPQLTMQEILILAAALKRRYQERNRHTEAEKSKSHWFGRK